MLLIVITDNIEIGISCFSDRIRIVSGVIVFSGERNLRNVHTDSQWRY